MQFLTYRFESCPDSKTFNMKNGKIYTKDEAISYMASQGLVYSGLDEYLDEWFENYCSDWGFESIGDDKYVYHEDDW